MKRILLLLLFIGCTSGSSDMPAVDAPQVTVDAAIDTPPMTAFALTSPAFTTGSTIPVMYTCNGGVGGNISPQLVWPAGPTGTMSYALVFTDKANDLVHWVIYDIPASATGLPMNVQKAYMPNNVTGAKQTLSYQNVRGYLGPCPQNTHTYEFVVYAIDVATLPGVTMASTRADVVPVIQQHDLAMAPLSGTYGP